MKFAIEFGSSESMVDFILKNELLGDWVWSSFILGFFIN